MSYVKLWEGNTQSNLPCLEWSVVCLNEGVSPAGRCPPENWGDGGARLS